MAKEDERHDLLSGLDHRFGIPENVFDDYLLFNKKSAWWILNQSDHIVSVSSLKIWKAGFKAFQKIGSFFKPSTRIIQQFGKYASRSVIEIDNEAIDIFMNGKALPVDVKLENGYVILSLRGIIAGLGLLIDGSIRSQIPKIEIKIWD